jgi:hypothetical protein
MNSSLAIEDTSPTENEIISSIDVNTASDTFNFSVETILNTLQYSSIPQIVFDEVETLLLHLRPTFSTLLSQKLVLDYIVKVLFQQIGTIAVPVGVSYTDVFLVGEEIDMVLVFPHILDEKWHLDIHSAFGSAPDSPQQLQSLQFDRQKNSALLVFEGFRVKIFANQISLMYCSALFDEVDSSSIPSQNGLMKKSFMLIKSWVSTDSPLSTTGLRFKSSLLHLTSPHSEIVPDNINSSHSASPYS